ncbi:MAG: hypothetical protein ACM359_20285 [Bacillota bacterium]
MVLKKCPSCKNIVSMDSYCCPRCGIDFRALRIRRVLKWTCLLALAAWLIHRYLLP